jgi:hypothetical protein
MKQWGATCDNTHIWIYSHKISVQLVTNMESVFTKTLLLWKNGTKGCGALVSCQITAGVLSGMCLRLIANRSHQLKNFKIRT